MSLDLPIIRLTRTTDQNVRLARDPLEASMTFYTFLRSVPSRAEQAYAMDDFRRHATGYYRASHSTFSASEQRERTIQQLESAVFDGLLRYPPAVSPSWCRAHRRECLGPLLERRSTSAEHSTVVSSMSSSPGQSPPAQRAAPHTQHPQLHADEIPFGNSEQIAARHLQQFVDPYTAYERHHNHHSQRVATAATTEGDWNTSIALSSVAAGSVSRGASTAASAEASPSRSLNPRSATRRPDDVRPGFAEADEEEVEEGTPDTQTPSAPSSLEATSRMVMPRTAAPHAIGTDAEESVVENPHSAQTAAARDVASAGMHPLVRLLLRQVRVMNETDSMRAEDHDAAFFTAMSTKLEETAQHLNRTHEAMREAAEHESEARSIWCTSHAHYKAADNYLSDLQKRLRAATRLFAVQRQEQATVQAAHLAIAVETTALGLLLRDVQRSMDEAGERLDVATAQPAGTLDDQTRQDMQVDMAFLVELRDLMATGGRETV